jgi:sugar lactone lactonase YvrE
VTPDGRVVVADTYNDRIRVIESDGTVRTLAGSERPGANDGVADGASFATPTGIALDARGILYVADTGNGVVGTVDLDGRVSTPPWAHGDGFYHRSASRRRRRRALRGRRRRAHRRHSSRRHQSELGSRCRVPRW